MIKAGASPAMCWQTIMLKLQLWYIIAALTGVAQASPISSALES